MSDLNTQSRDESPSDSLSRPLNERIELERQRLSKELETTSSPEANLGQARRQAHLALDLLQLEKDPVRYFSAIDAAELLRKDDEFVLDSHVYRLLFKAAAQLPSSANAVTKYLSCHWPRFREEAADALASQPEMASLLIRQLKIEQDGDVRIKLIQAISGDENAEHLILHFLRYSSDEVRVAAAYALAGSELAKGALIEALTDIDHHLRAAAASSLKGMEGARESLKITVLDPLSSVSDAAIEALRDDKVALDEMNKQLASSNDNSFTQLLRAVPAEMLDGQDILRALRIGNYKLRDHVAAVLPNHPDVIEELIFDLDSTNASVRKFAARALANIPQAKDSLLETLRDPEPFVVASAINSLPVEDSIAESIVPFLKSDNEYLRFAAVSHLKKYGDKTSELRNLISDEYEWLRLVVIEAVSGSAEAFPELVDLLPNAEWKERLKIAKALAQEPQQERAVEILITLFKDESDDVREQAAESLAEMPSARGKLIELTQSEH